MNVNPHIGSSLEDFLEEEGRLEEATAIVIKRVLAWPIDQAMKQQRLSKAEMARRMKTSRSPLDRLPDPAHTAVTLYTMPHAAAVLGKRLRLDLVDVPQAETSASTTARRRGRPCRTGTCI